jgi:hypothetical protein
VHLELSSLQGTMKVAARAQLVYRALVGALVEHLGASPTLILGAVHRGVGVAKQAVGAVAGPARHRHTEAGGHEHLALR